MCAENRGYPVGWFEVSGCATGTSDGQFYCFSVPGYGGCLPACIICFSISSLGGLRWPRGDLVKGCMFGNIFGYVSKLPQIDEWEIRFDVRRVLYIWQ